MHEGFDSLVVHENLYTTTLASDLNPTISVERKSDYGDQGEYVLTDGIQDVDDADKAKDRFSFITA